MDPSADEGGDGSMCLGIRTVMLLVGLEPFFLLEGTTRQENWERLAVRWVRRVHLTRDQRPHCRHYNNGFPVALLDPQTHRTFSFSPMQKWLK